MQVKCLRGYYIFRESEPGEVSEFESIYGLDLDTQDDFFTFSFLKDAPGYSIKGDTYLGVTATATIEGKPWDIFKANDLVYDFTQNKLVLIDTITQKASFDQARYYFLNSGLIVPGTLTDDGDRVTEYSAFYDSEFGKFKYSEVSFE